MTNELSLVVKLHAREPAFSFASSVAALNGVSATDFSTDMGFSFIRITDGNADDLSELATLCSVDVDALSAWTPIHLGNRVHEFRGQHLQVKAIKETTLRGWPYLMITAFSELFWRARVLPLKNHLLRRVGVWMSNKTGPVHRSTLIFIWLALLNSGSVRLQPCTLHTGHNSKKRRCSTVLSAIAQAVTVTHCPWSSMCPEPSAIA